MPELPEVETTAADLRPQLLGQQIIAIHVLWHRTIAEPDPDRFIAALAGRRIRQVGRRGKFLLFQLDPGGALLVHLRMTGRLRVEPPDGALPDESHVRVWFELADGRRLVFTDARKFGRMWLVEDPGDLLSGLGPEPLDAAFTAEALWERIHTRRGPIKPLLLDQRILAGLGNIYADEALFLARIHPLRRASSLNKAETERLYAAIRRVLSDALVQRGTTLRDYRPPYGEQGNYQDRLLVYQRESQPCPNCGQAIERTVIAQRSAHYCPHCQPLSQGNE